MSLRRSIIILILAIASAFLFSCNDAAHVQGEPADLSSDTLPKDSDPDITTEYLPPETEPPYDFPTDPALYEAIPEEEYGLSINEDKRSAPFELKGTLRSATGTSLNLMVEWKAVREEGDDFATVNLDIAIEHKSLVSQNFIGSFFINGTEYVFMSPFYEYNSSVLTREWLCPVSLEVPCGYGEETVIDISANWTFNGNYEKRKIDGIKLEAKLPIGEKYAALKTKVSYDVENILQRPELPEGCEVTSLAIILKYLGFDISHTYLADNYLQQGPVGKTSYYEMNIGNPREEGKSWGCYSPVIVKTANKYLASMKSYYRAYNYTGYDINELYYQVSMGHPAIVWITMNFEEPYVKSPWNVNGERLYWKYPLHCVVISGYDFQKDTVTITDPLKKNPVTIDRKTFELRWQQMESQAVVIKMSREKSE